MTEYKGYKIEQRTENGNEYYIVKVPGVGTLPGTFATPSAAKAAVDAELKRGDSPEVKPDEPAEPDEPDEPRPFKM